MRRSNRRVPATVARGGDSCYYLYMGKYIVQVQQNSQTHAWVTLGEIEPHDLEAERRDINRINADLGWEKYRILELGYDQVMGKPQTDR